MIHSVQLLSLSRVTLHIQDIQKIADVLTGIKKKKKNPSCCIHTKNTQTRVRTHTHMHTHERTQNTFYSSQAQSSKRKVESHSAYAQPYASAFVKQIMKY